MSPEFRAGERVPQDRRMPITSAESQTYIDTGERPRVTTHTWTEHTFTCTGCKRVARASQEAIDEVRRSFWFEEGTGDAYVAQSLDFCIACVGGEPGPEGEHVALCHGSEGVNNEPICTGPDVKTVQAREPGDDAKGFTTDWCSECRATAMADGYSVVVI